MFLRQACHRCEGEEGRIKVTSELGLGSTCFPEGSSTGIPVGTGMALGILRWLPFLGVIGRLANHFNSIIVPLYSLKSKSPDETFLTQDAV